MTRLSPRSPDPGIPIPRRFCPWLLKGAMSFVALIALLASGAVAQKSQNPAPASTGATDYTKPANWLCLPGRDNDACSVDISATVVAPNGSTVLETFAATPDAPIDCFYVYPTVSNDPGGNSDLIAGPEELGVIRNQFARFGSQCRLYAPLYRQVTLTALRARMSGQTVDSDRALAYSDVVAAWNEYLAHHNDDRGVVLIGHSQGSGVLKVLIAEHIDGKPVAQRVISAMLLGTSVAVPSGKDVGGDFQHMPLCRSNSQTGCVVSYATFRKSTPPPEASLFARSRQDGDSVACTNPAALAGGLVTLDAYLPSAGLFGQTVTWTEGATITTPFVKLPGLLSGQCVERDGASYFEVTITADPADPRTDEIPGDVFVGGAVSPGWGLHLIDVDVVIGDLVELVGQQGAAYRGMMGKAGHHNH